MNKKKYYMLSFYPPFRKPSSAFSFCLLSCFHFIKEVQCWFRACAAIQENFCNESIARYPCPHCDGKDEIPANMLRFSAFAKNKKGIGFDVQGRSKKVFKTFFGNPGKHWIMGQQAKREFSRYAI